MRKIIQVVITLTMLVFVIQEPIFGQETGKKRLYVFAEISDQDKQYVSRELPFIVFVRDPKLSDVQILINSLRTGGGGERHVISLIGYGPFEGLNEELDFQSGLNNSDEEIRAGITETVKFGLMPYISKTDIKKSMLITFNDSANLDIDTLNTQSVLDNDPWNNWVFEIGGDVWFNKEENQSDYTLRGTFEADKITDIWRIRNYFSYRVQTEEFVDDEDKIVSNEEDWFHNSSVVRSLTDNWSVGFFTGTNSSTYNNMQFSAHAAPAVEYNFFPWDELDKHELTLAYSPGVRYNNYRDTTIYGQKAQYLGYESLTMRLEMIKPWGEFEAYLSGFHYFHNPNYYNIELKSELSIRLTKNLAFDIEVGIESIHDQIYLPKGDASRDEILLRQRQLATTYEIDFEVGLEYTFGSIYNTVVNRRL